jgi:glycosyltransferase involved in cell wall biosynthesis
MSIFRARNPGIARISLDQLPQRALEIHRMRPDLREAFNLDTPEGRRKLYWWYYMHGFREMYLNFQAPEDLKGPVNGVAGHLPVHWSIPVTWLMREFWVRGAVPGTVRQKPPKLGLLRASFRALYRPTTEPRTAKEQRHLLSWYFCFGLSDYNLLGLMTPEQADKLTRCDGNENSTPLILRWAHSYAIDLHGEYPDAADERWLRWCAEEGKRRFPILAQSLIHERLFLRAVSKVDVVRTFDGIPFGVNLIGHAGTRSGVGEDLQMASRALEAAGIPFVVRNIRPSTGVIAEDEGRNAQSADHSPFSINMFCMAGMETVTALSTRKNLLDGKFNVGFWPWELPRWPELWSHAPQLMDELWASTSFTAEAYRRSTSVPIRQVAMAVETDETDGLARSDFGLPPDRFLFAYSFDGHSSFSRKNPEAVIKAFRLAFPKGDEPAGLLLKGLRVSNHPLWSRLEALAAEDTRILLMSASMPRGALLDLYRAIDCFVSLHRSEGFGRNIAECMLLGKPVIATDYSGNADFTLESTAALVSAELAIVNDGEYPFGAGQHWADPSAHHAAEHMRRMLCDREWRNHLATAGQTFIREHYSPKIVGTKFSRELKRIATKITKEGASGHR